MNSWSNKMTKQYFVLGPTESRFSLDYRSLTIWLFQMIFIMFHGDFTKINDSNVRKIFVACWFDIWDYWFFSLYDIVCLVTKWEFPKRKREHHRAAAALINVYSAVIWHRTSNYLFPTTRYHFTVSYILIVSDVGNRIGRSRRYLGSLKLIIRNLKSGCQNTMFRKGEKCYNWNVRVKHSPLVIFYLKK